MKALLTQKLPLSAQTSFVAKTFRTPHYEVSWHQHVEVELILHTEGSGQCFIGDYVGKYDTGDIFLLGSDLPHTFQKNGVGIASAVVVQFRDNFWGDTLLNLPESKGIRKLLDRSLQGLRILPEGRRKLTPLIRTLEHQNGFSRIVTLSQCMLQLAECKHFKTLSSKEIHLGNVSEKERIDRIFNYTFKNFKEPILIEQVAAIIQMSVTAFSQYFKKSVHKTYLDFLIEVRIGYACQLLADTSFSVADICYQSGFNTLSNFHRQFLKLREMTPLQYRECLNKSFSLTGA